MNFNQISLAFFGIKADWISVDQAYSQAHRNWIGVVNPGRIQELKKGYAF